MEAHVCAALHGGCDGAACLGLAPLQGAGSALPHCARPVLRLRGCLSLPGRKRVPSTAAALPRVFQSSGTGMRDRRAGSEQEGDTAGGGRVCWGVLESRQRLEVGAAQVPVGAHPPAAHFQFPRTSLPLGLGPGPSCAPQGQGSPGPSFPSGSPTGAAEGLSCCPCSSLGSQPLLQRLGRQHQLSPLGEAAGEQRP